MFHLSSKDYTCPAMPVATVILRALDRVRGRALGLLGSGSPKSQPPGSQPHQALRGVAKVVISLNGASRQDGAEGPWEEDYSSVQLL